MDFNSKILSNCSHNTFGMPDIHMIFAIFWASLPDERNFRQIHLTYPKIPNEPWQINVEPESKTYLEQLALLSKFPLLSKAVYLSI